MMRVRFLTAAAVCFLTATLLPARASAQSEVVEYYALDAIGSVRVVFDATGGIKSRRDYAPFGEEVTSITADPKMYAGLFRDDESTLDYAQARMYQSRTGRFTGVDPIYAGLFEPQKWNRYAYALNAPVHYVDADGRDPLWVAGVTVTAGQIAAALSFSTSVTVTAKDPGPVPSLLGGFGSALADGWENLPEVSAGGSGNVGQTLTAGGVLETLENVNDLINPSKDFNQCTAGAATSCLAVAAAIVPTGKVAAQLPRLVARLPISLQKTLAYPTKVGGGGKPQFWDPTNGQYLSHLAPLWRNPHQFVLGLLEGGVAGAGGMPPPTSGARGWGQTVGQAISTLWDLIR